MLLTEEQEQVRDTAREFAQHSLAPHSSEWDSQAVFPRAALRELGKLGYMGMTVPPEWDGAGTDYIAYALALEEIAAGDGAISTIMSGPKRLTEQRRIARSLVWLFEQRVHRR